MPGRRLSNESGISSKEKLQVPNATSGLNALSRNAKGGSRKLKLSDSVASSIASNLNRFGGAQDLTHMLCSDDYFSEVNPRSMRRLMNVACVTGVILIFNRMSTFESSIELSNFCVFEKIAKN